MRRLPLVALLLLLIASACGIGADESGDYRTVSADGWLYGDTLAFGPLD